MVNQNCDGEEDGIHWMIKENLFGGDSDFWAGIGLVGGLVWVFLMFSCVIIGASLEERTPTEGEDSAEPQASELTQGASEVEVVSETP